MYGCNLFEGRFAAVAERNVMSMTEEWRGQEEYKLCED